MSQNVRLGLFIVLGLAVLTGGIFLIGGRQLYVAIDLYCKSRIC